MNNKPSNMRRHGDLSQRLKSLIKDIEKIKKRFHKNSNLLKRKVLLKDDQKEDIINIKIIMEKELEAFKYFDDIMKIISSLEGIYKKI